MTNQIGIYDFSTGENIVRDMTKKELEEHEIKLQQTANAEQEKLIKETQRNALLTKMGITQEEANLLLGITQEEEKPSIG